MIENSRAICAGLLEADLVHSRSERDRTRIYAHAERSLAAVRSLLRRLKLKRVPEQRIRALAQEVVARLKRELESEKAAQALTRP
jgi:predicted component of type VI protein secretion system